MQTVQDVPTLHATIRRWRKKGEKVALVPTMGHLHTGHYRLLQKAQAHADRVVVSVFVNPAQFGPDEDFNLYPRTLAQDQAGLVKAGCDLLFVPETTTMYPYGVSFRVNVHVPQITRTLEGAYRPGFFDGVTTVVSKLFHLVQPDIAVFGQKDFQQFKVIERMVTDLWLPVIVIQSPTVRASDGMALSSRSCYLSAAQRRLAPQIHATLMQMREQMSVGNLPWCLVEHEAISRLERFGFVPDYAVIRRVDDLTEPAEGQREGLMALIAARLGSTRLIDNLLFDLHGH